MDNCYGIQRPSQTPKDMRTLITLKKDGSVPLLIIVKFKSFELGLICHG